MKMVLFSINRPHTDNIKIGAKKCELRTKPPKIREPYKALVYETKKNGGCGRVIGEFTAFNEFTHRICMGVPKHLVLEGCVSVEDIWAYTNKGEKDLTEISISDFVLYEKPKDLSDFSIKRTITTLTTEYNIEGIVHYPRKEIVFDKLTRPPQSWCYVYNTNTKGEDD